MQQILINMLSIRSRAILKINCDGALNRYEKIRMDKDAIPKAERGNRSGGKKRMNRTIRVSAAGDILIMKRLLPGCFANSLKNDAVRSPDGKSGNNDIGRQLLRIGVFRRNMADGRCEVSGRHPAVRF